MQWKYFKLNRCNEGFSINSPKLNNTRTLTKTLLKSEDHYQVASFKALTNFKKIIVATTLPTSNPGHARKFEQRKSHAVKGFEEFYY
jgi:hypothetical protein